MIPKYKPCSTDHVTLLPNQTGVDRSLIQIFSHLKLKYIFHENEVIPFSSIPGIGPNITTHYEKSPEAAPFLQLLSLHAGNVCTLSLLPQQYNLSQGSGD